jgi:O-antigen/teichoic acid export membrane protein
MTTLKKNYILNLTFHILNIIIPVITVPYLSRVLEPDGIGIYSFCLSIVNYFILFGNLGIQLYGQREIAKVRDNIYQRSKIFYELIILRLIFVLFSLLVYFSLCYFTLKNYRTYLIILSLQIFSIIFDISWYFQALEKFSIIIARSLIFKLINILLIFLFIKNKNDLIKYFIIHVSCSFLSNLSLITIVRKYLCKINFRTINFFNHLKNTIMLFLPQVAIEIYTVLDKTMIGLITKNNFENGYYEQSEKIIKLLLTVITSMAAVIIPRASYYIGKNNKKKFISLIEKSYSFALMLSLPMMAGILVISKIFVPVFFGQGYENVIPLMKIFSLLFISIGINNVTGMQYLIPSNRDSLFTISVTIGAISNLILNLILIPLYSAIGAAVASVAAESIITIFQLIMCRKEIHFFKLLKENIKCFIAAFLMFITISLLDNKLTCNNINRLIIITVSGIIIYFISLLIIKYKLIIDLFLKKYINTVNLIYFYSKKNETKIKKLFSKIKILFTYRFFNSSNLNTMLKKIKNTKNEKEKNQYLFDYYIDTKCVPLLKHAAWNNFTPDYEKILLNGYLKYKNKAESFQEALQRILFLNQLMWQAGHKLVGLGRLDFILNDFFENDLKNNIISETEALNLIKNFLITLHKYYKFKSSLLIGDTGQIIILGGLDKNYNAFNSRLTLLFIQAFYELKLPDPKFVLRYNKQTSIEIFTQSLICLKNNCGSPVFCSDAAIIEAMKTYGYDSSDCWNYGLSACWEPLIPGKSRDVNNYYTINLLQPFADIFKNGISYKEFCEKYFKEIELISNRIKERIDDCTFDKSEIFDYFVENKYNYFGVTVSGFINCVKAFLNIKNNTINNESFDYTDDEFIYEAKYIFEKISKIFYPIKIGTSSPSYINFSSHTPATPDGRKDFENFEIHISDKHAKDYSSVFIFASNLDYKENRLNGNITDIVLTSNELQNNFENIKNILITALTTGVFEIQISILDYNTLIKAKQNPELYPDLIVRVWGFSAYFKDLPPSYQDFIIERARQHENN